MPDGLAPRAPRTAATLVSAALVVATMPAAGADPRTDWQACLASLRTDAPARGIPAAEFDRLTRPGRWQSTTIEKSGKQPEFTIDWPTYLARVVTAERIASGRALRATWQDALAAIAQRYGVDAATVLAIWGIESNYGQRLGEIPVLDAWITRACIEPAKPLWRDNVYASLRLLRQGKVAQDGFVGSWSGAFGLTQFIPTSFETFARDGDGDGRIDLFHSVPDALASTANHLASRTTWRPGMPAAIEVRFPPALRSGVPSDGSEWRSPGETPLGDWAARGVTRADGSPLPPTLDLRQAAAAFFPEGADGRGFLVTRNFDALLAYNRSTKYALSVALVAAAIEAP